jgi:23S rRNA pseudouridine955/2504/2580 synthase
MNGLGEMVAEPVDSGPASSVARRPHRSVSADGGDGAIAVAGQVTQVRVGVEEAGQRLDNYLLRHAKGVPKSHIYRIVRGGEVRVNGKRVDVSRRLEAGDTLRIPPMRIAARARDPVARREKATALSIVHEDDAILVVDKPAGIAVHGGSGISFGVIEQLRAQRPEARFLELVHRLDRETSGLLIVAKKRSALVRLHADWRDGRVAKHYLACTAGAWPEARRQVKAPLVKFKLADGERRVRVAGRDDQDGMPALTIFRLVERYACGPDRYALLDVEIKTGRTHQIRVHLAHLGRPILGDDKYGDFDVNHRLARAASPPVLKRMFLHAASLRFNHPLTDLPLALEAPLPSACRAFLAGMERVTDAAG